MTYTITIVALVVAAILGWNVYRRFLSDRIGAINEKRRAGSRLVSRGEFVDGNRHVDVALALTKEAFYYENTEMQASIDLQWVREIEYDSELATGISVGAGRLLRMRSDSQIFEFVLPQDMVTRWTTTLPPRAAKVALGDAV